MSNEISTIIQIAEQKKKSKTHTRKQTHKYQPQQQIHTYIWPETLAFSKPHIQK